MLNHRRRKCACVCDCISPLTLCFMLTVLSTVASVPLLLLLLLISNKLPI